MAEDKPPVEVEPDEQETAPVQAPYGTQDHNIAVEPDPDISLGPGDEVERVLETELHVDMGRGALTFKAGDRVYIKEGQIYKVETAEGIKYEFTDARQAALDRRRGDIQAEMLHQNLSARATSLPDAPASPAPRPQTETQLAADRMGGVEDTEEAIMNQPAGAFELGAADEDDAIPVTPEELPAANPPDPEPAEQPPGKGPERDEEGHPLHPHGGPPGQQDKPSKAEQETAEFDQPRTSEGKFAPKKGDK